MYTYPSFVQWRRNRGAWGALAPRSKSGGGLSTPKFLIFLQKFW
jgi:hypothetical protein